MNKYCEFFSSEIGMLKITATEDAVLSVCFTDIQEAQNPNSVTQACAGQLAEYFAGRRKTFHLPLSPQGTPFQRAVWAVLGRIPYGQVKSYEDIAAAVGNRKAVRAVGQANKHNPIAIIIPCHRVLRKDGSLGGYNGKPECKQRLLDLETAHRSSAS